MQIRPIHTLRIFDTIRDFRHGTHLSATIDGEAVYSLFVKNVDTISSGTNTVGAFRNNKPDSVLAWIDPVSGAFMRTRRLKTSATVQALPLLVSAFAAIGLYVAGVLRQGALIPVSAGLLLAVVLLSVLIRHGANKTLEHKLRARLAR